MERLKRATQVFWGHKDKRPWPNPRESIGDPVKKSPDGEGTYWIAKGPAREVWEGLGPDIKNCIENGACEYGSVALALEIYMFGSKEDTAAPRILICSEDKKAREQVLKEIQKSEIMNRHPAISLEQIPTLTLIPLSQDQIELNITSNPSIWNGTLVLTPPQDNAFGRRLFISKQNASSLRSATAGPILHINGKVYQLTVGHAFMGSGDFLLPQAGSEALEHQEVDRQMGVVKSVNSDIRLGIAGESNPAHDGASTGDSTHDRLQRPSPSAAQGSSTIGTIRKPSHDSGVNLARDEVSAANDRVVPRKLDSLGTLAWLSDTSISNSPDYALIELEKVYCQGRNEVPCAPNASQRFLQVRRSAEDGPRDVSIITMTASSGFMTGQLCATASYVRLPNQRTLQKLYSVLLNGKLADGDCGSGVVDRATGVMFGHIVAGTAGTGHAYIVPIEDVFRDIREKMGGDVGLIPPASVLDPPAEQHLKLSKIFKGESSKQGDPLRVVEFASPGYFKELKQSNRLRSPGDIGQSEQMPPNSKIGLVPHDPTLKSMLSKARKGTWSKGKRCDYLSRYKVAKGDPFEEHFFALPTELRDHVIGYLDVPDFLSLRLVSKSWHKLITVHEKSISKAFLDYNPVPSFALGLYPQPPPADLGLQYIYGLWHRLSMTSKLSRLMADWISTDMFLHKEATQQLQFLAEESRIRRRLIPILFTLFHFFEEYRPHHLNHLLENDFPLLPEGWKFNPVERKIMHIYENQILLQVTQVFPILISYIDRKLRPPSYFGGLERSLHGYVRRPWPEHVNVGLLCIGGLKEVTKVLKIEGYNDRRAAVEDWYSAAFEQPIDYTPKARHWPLAFGKKRSTPTTSCTAAHESNSETPTSTSIRLITAQGEHPDNTTNTIAKGKQKSSPDDSSRLPGQQLSVEHARLLLKDLPTLKQLWVPTSEALLVAAHVVDRLQDIKRKGQAIHELIIDKFTAADELFYGCTEEEFSQNNARLGWGDLLDDNVHSTRS